MSNVLTVIGVLIASAMTDASDFGAQEAWRYITYLTIGYMIARGLAKAGSRNFFDRVTTTADPANRQPPPSWVGGCSVWSKGTPLGGR